MGDGPFPGIQPADMIEHLESGHRNKQPDNCPNEMYVYLFNYILLSLDRKVFASVEKSNEHNVPMKCYYPIRFILIF